MQPRELRDIARAVSAVENQDEGYEALLAEACRATRRPRTIGITGPPGVGKSTLVDALTAHWAAAGERIAVLAIDPSSPYSGGAVLGDRIRRDRSNGYDDIYFRSLSSRGHVGGLNETANDIVTVLARFAFDRVIIETVGAGQADVEIHLVADCTIVVTVPGLGDGIQASKAGLMEIGDIFTINKSDMPGADLAARTVEAALAVVYTGEHGVNNSAAHPPVPIAHVTPGLAALRRRHGDCFGEQSFWVPPVLAVTAADNAGVPDLASRIDSFLAWSEGTGRLADRARERAYAQLLRALSGLLLARFLRAPGDDAMPVDVAPWIERILSGEVHPLQAARVLLGDGGRRPHVQTTGSKPTCE